MSPPNPCRSCGTPLQHCLEMRAETETFCCVPCQDIINTNNLALSLHILPPTGTGYWPPLDGPYRQDQWSWPRVGEFNDEPHTRTTQDLRPGDTIRSGDLTVRMVKTNAPPPRPESRWHVLIFEDGTSFWSDFDDIWEVLPAAPPLPKLREYAVRNSQGEIFPMPSLDYAQHVAEGAPDLQAVSRSVPTWEVLR
jgi:hypothetical protein